SLAHFSALPNMAGPMRSCGGIVDAGDLSWTYVPCELAARLPELTVALLVLAPVPLVAWARRALRGGAPARRAALLDARMAGWALLVLTVAVPIATAVALNVILYDGVRHFLFAIPLLAIVAGAVLDRAWSLPLGAWRPAAGGLLAAYALTKLVDLATLHPVAYVQVNQFFGGPAAAREKFELDYQDGGLHLGARWIGRRFAAEGRTATARICVDWRDDLWFMAPGLRQPAPDETPAFVVMGGRSACSLPEGAQLIGHVERRGLVLARIYRTAAAPP
ncbi:MAG: hypothetical protein JNK11_17635, partial [Alphaproteobacteria bacterium]|nr:hypothetical protein [Alphaproteobacteria bacterium]